MRKKLLFIKTLLQQRTSVVAAIFLLLAIGFAGARTLGLQDNVTPNNVVNTKNTNHVSTDKTNTDKKSVLGFSTIADAQQNNDNNSSINGSVNTPTNNLTNQNSGNESQNSNSTPSSSCPASYPLVSNTGNMSFCHYTDNTCANYVCGDTEPGPSPTCRPRPACLDANPPCMIMETEDMCPAPSPTPSPSCPASYPLVATTGNMSFCHYTDKTCTSYVCGDTIHNNPTPTPSPKLCSPDCDPGTGICSDVMWVCGGLTLSPTPSPTCTPRPSCLDGHPACEIATPAGGWCSQ